MRPDTRYIRTKPHLINGKLARPEDVIRVRMLEEPTYDRIEFDKWEWDTGEFEWTIMQDGKVVKFNVDTNGLKNEVDSTSFEGKYDAILTKLLNFWKVYLIIPTGEIIVT